MADWQREAFRVTGLALASCTRKGYAAVCEEFREFRANMSLDLIWPTPVEHLQQFCVHLSLKGLAPVSIQSKRLH